MRPELHPATDDRGVVIPMTAIILTTLIFFVALAVDIGNVASEIRKLQKVADIASLDAARILDGRTDLQLTLSNEVTNEVAASVARNGYSGTTPVVELGKMVKPTAAPAYEPYFVPTLDAEIPDAVKVTVTDTVDYFFQPGSNTKSRSAVGHRNPMAWVTIGSVAAGLQPSPPNLNQAVFVRALCARMAKQFGGVCPATPVPGVDLASYQGLAAANLTWRQIAAAAGFASPEEMFAADMTAGQFFDATIDALNSSGQGGAATDLQNFRTATNYDEDQTMKLGDTFGFDQSCPAANPDDNTPCAADSNVNVLDLFTGGANAMDGSNFVTYSFDTGIPGVGVANVRMATIEAAQSKLLRRFDGDFGDDSQTVETSQVRFQVDLVVTVPLVGVVTLPIVLDSARAVGRLTETECREATGGPAPAPINDSSRDKVLVETSAVRARVGTMTDVELKKPAGILSQALLYGAVRGSSDVSAGGGSQTLTFFPNQPKDTGPPSQRSMGGAGAGLGASLISSLTTTLPGPANASLVTSLNTVLNGINNLDKNVFNPLFTAAGVSLGGADVRSYSMDCNVPQLVE
jgi:uncharacterized membrane protein